MYALLFCAEGTFSIRKMRGANLVTIEAKENVRAARSPSTPPPALEKSWQGGPPIIISTGCDWMRLQAVSTSFKSALTVSVSKLAR